MDTDAFERLRQGGQKDIGVLYDKYLSGFVKYIRSAFGCSVSNAQELYPEAFSILYFNIQQGKLGLPLTSTMQTYLNSIGWNLYHRRYLDKYNRSKVSADPIDLIHQSKEFVEDAIMLQDRARHVEAYLEKLGDPCKALLYHVYYEEKSYEELSVSSGLPETTLRKRKFDCLRKLREMMNIDKLEL